MTAGQVASRNHRRRTKINFKTIAVTPDRYKKIREYAQEENIYLVQALERMVDAFFD
jgi:hypothetical protein